MDDHDDTPLDSYRITVRDGNVIVMIFDDHAMVDAYELAPASAYEVGQALLIAAAAATCRRDIEDADDETEPDETEEEQPT